MKTPLNTTHAPRLNALIFDQAKARAERLRGAAIDSGVRTLVRKLRQLWTRDTTPCPLGAECSAPKAGPCHCAA